MSSFDIYAELSRSMVQKDILSQIKIPPGVHVNNRNGSSVIFVECDDENSVRDMIDILDEYGISWQNNSEEEIPVD